VRGMITISEQLPVKENIYTQVSSVRGVLTISEQLPVKEKIICALLQEVVLILLSFLSLMVAVYMISFI
jgi:hypothetical protein